MDRRNVRHRNRYKAFCLILDKGFCNYLVHNYHRHGIYWSKNKEHFNCFILENGVVVGKKWQ